MSERTWLDVAELIESQLHRIEGEAMDAAQRAQHPDAGTEHTVDEIAKLLEESVQVRVQLGPELFRFNSFTQWVNKASSWYSGYRMGEYISVDQCGRICSTGKQFGRARDECKFPIVVYSIEPESK